MRCFDYISRIGKSRGFGIQSPWAYSFVRDVIMERMRYYAYDDIERNYPDKRECKLEKLSLRLRNYSQDDGFYRISISNLQSDLSEIKPMFGALKTNGIILVEDINRDENCIRLWSDLKLQSWVGITFDLYHVAICFAPSDKYKQHYRLNF